MSQVNTNPIGYGIGRTVDSGARIWRRLLVTAALSPVIAVGLFGACAFAQATPATRNLTDSTILVDANFVMGWLAHAQHMIESGKTEAATASFAEALRARKSLATPEPTVERRAQEVARLLASRNITPAQITAAAAQLGASRPAPAVQTASAQGPVASASSGQTQVDGTGVVPGVFQPQRDATSVEMARAQSVAAATDVLPEASGDQLYQRGIELLGRGEREQALEIFRQAWNHQGELDPAIRSALKDKLASLQASGSPESVAANALSPQERAQLEERQRWMSEVTGEIADAKRFRESEPLLVAERLQILRTRISQANVGGDFRQRMLTHIDRAITEHQVYMDQNRATIDQNTRNKQIKEQINLEHEQRYKIDQQIASLVETYNDLMDKHEYMQAETVAKQVGALDPDSTIASLLIASARNARRIGEYEAVRTNKEDGFIDAMLDVDRSARPVSDENSFQFPKGWEDISRKRLASQDRESQRGMSPAEVAIWEKLKQLVMVNFDQRPLREVVKTLSDMTGVMIVLDTPGMAQESIQPDELITLDLPSPIQLRSALALMLNSRNLDFQVVNEVLKITSVRNTAQANRSIVYNVKDLVIPIPNFVTDYNSGMAGALRQAYETINNGLVARTQPRYGSGENAQFGAQSQLVSTSLNPDSQVLGQFGGANMPPGMGGMPGMPGLGGGMNMLPGTGFGGSGPVMGGPPIMAMGSPSPIGGGGAAADFASLMNLIQQTIEPDNWAANGGTSTMLQYPANLSLVVSAPQTTHEKIADLLESLRRLQDLQVTIEVKFITLTDNFFERMGVDFDLRVEDGNRRIPSAEQKKGRTVVGLRTGSTATNPFPFTADLDVAFDQNNFDSAVPAFGGFPGVANAGINMGFAILSELEMFFFMNAAQGDQRTNVLQAPRVTMFDGQFASINDTVSRPFVTSLIPVVGDFAVAQQPVIVVLNEGTILNVQSTISHDKRSVRLTLNPTFSQIDKVDTFTFEGSRRTRSTSRRSGDNILNPDDGSVDEEDEEEETIISGTTVQQPSFSSTNVSTTVSVPDGGTILLGGIKRMRESRIERGVPILSKIPYLNRLFKNTAIGRETSTLMLTVTPRIIILEEEEQKYGVFDN
ncbi:MAG: general secretion pathway protein GspD [Pirellulaceae bacterium]|nr:general secretion pathway protein GspD [Pirellulaceae bacterium]